VVTDMASPFEHLTLFDQKVGFGKTKEQRWYKEAREIFAGSAYDVSQLIGPTRNTS
jgi:hypothetical protein